MVKRTKRHSTMNAVLEYIKNSGRPVSVEEITNYFSLHKQTIYGHVRALLRMECIKKIPGKGSGFNYVYMGEPSKRDLSGKSSTKVLASERSVLTMSISPSQLAGLIAQWSKEPWQPKAFKAARYLPLGLARLYELAYEASYGANISQIDLDEIRQNMNLFRQETEQLLKVVNGVLQIQDLWSTSTFAAFLIEGGPVDKLKEQAFDAKQIN